MTLLLVLAAWFAAGVLTTVVLGPRLRRAAELAGVALEPQPVSLAHRSPLRWRVGTLGVVGLLAGSTGMAAAGALPGSAQTIAHHVLGTVGVDVPESPSLPEVAAAPTTTPWADVGGGTPTTTAAPPLPGPGGDAALPAAGGRAPGPGGPAPVEDDVDDAAPAPPRARPTPDRDDPVPGSTIPEPSDVPGDDVALGPPADEPSDVPPDLAPSDEPPPTTTTTEPTAEDPSPPTEPGGDEPTASGDVPPTTTVPPADPDPSTVPEPAAG